MLRCLLPLLLFCVACPAGIDPLLPDRVPPRSGPGEEDEQVDDDDDSRGDDDDTADDDDDDDNDDDHDDSAAACPAGMALIGGSFCIDRWEAALEEEAAGSWVEASPYQTVDARVVRAVSVEGRVPQGYISGDEAEAACARAGKRLCSSDEWLLACRGPAGWTWPYGNSWQAGACNDRYPGGHPVVDWFGTADGVWDPVHMNDPHINQQPDTVAPAGAFADCVSADGVYDLHGNLHEWVAEASGTFRGGFYADAEINGAGCSYRTTAHGRGYHDYSTGFRCCAERM